MPVPQYNYNPLRADSPEAQDVVSLAIWLNRRLQLLANVLKGPSSLAIAASGTAQTIKLYVVDLTQLTLTANCTVTLDTESRAGAVAELELTQDATGGRTVTWVNALWAASTPPTIAAGAGKRTMLRFVNNGSGWVGYVVASSY